MKSVIRFFVLVLSTPLTTAGDVPVTCVLSGDCLLPCTSRYHDVIHWYKDFKNDPVHSFYDAADQLKYQDVEFKGRTSLFNDQVPRGNVSLLLKRINFKDEGRYKCYTATNSENLEQFVSLKVQVPVKSVHLQMTSEGISCSTKDVYPQPKVSWYRDGSSLNTFTVNVTGDKERLFSVSSVLSQTVKENTTYSCYISLGDESQSYTASLRKENVEVSSGENVLLHCAVSQQNTENSIITLGFGETFTVLRERGSTWELMGKTVHRSDDGTVTIHNLEESGTYTCETETARSKQLVLTSVQIQSADPHSSEGGRTAAVVVGVVGLISVICIVAAVLIRKKSCSLFAKKAGQEKNEATEYGEAGGTSSQNILKEVREIRDRNGVL